MSKRALPLLLGLTLPLGPLAAATAEGPAPAQGDDPDSDRLKGTYYQAVAKQKYDVLFVRK